MFCRGWTGDSKGLKGVSERDPGVDILKSTINGSKKVIMKSKQIRGRLEKDQPEPTVGDLQGPEIDVNRDNNCYMEVSQTTMPWNYSGNT